MKNPEIFQGEKKIKTNDQYFEGWYFKNSNAQNGISFIPGINIENEDKKAFKYDVNNNTINVTLKRYPYEDFKKT